MPKKVVYKYVACECDWNRYGAWFHYRGILQGEEPANWKDQKILKIETDFKNMQQIPFLGFTDQQRNEMRWSTSWYELVMMFQTKEQTAAAGRAKKDDGCVIIPKKKISRMDMPRHLETEDRATLEKAVEYMPPRNGLYYEWSKQCYHTGIGYLTVYYEPKAVVPSDAFITPGIPGKLYFDNHGNAKADAVFSLTFGKSDGTTYVYTLNKPLDKYQQQGYVLLSATETSLLQPYINEAQSMNYTISTRDSEGNWIEKSATVLVVDNAIAFEPYEIVPKNKTVISKSTERNNKKIVTLQWNVNDILANYSGNQSAKFIISVAGRQSYPNTKINTNMTFVQGVNLGAVDITSSTQELATIEYSAKQIKQYAEARQNLYITFDIDDPLGQLPVLTVRGETASGATTLGVAEYQNELNLDIIPARDLYGIDDTLDIIWNNSAIYNFTVDHYIIKISVGENNGDTDRIVTSNADGRLGRYSFTPSKFITNQNLFEQGNLYDGVIEVVPVLPDGKELYSYRAELKFGYTKMDYWDGAHANVHFSQYDEGYWRKLAGLNTTYDIGALWYSCELTFSGYRMRPGDNNAILGYIIRVANEREQEAAPGQILGDLQYNTVSTTPFKQFNGLNLNDPIQYTITKYPYPTRANPNINMFAYQFFVVEKYNDCPDEVINGYNCTLIDTVVFKYNAPYLPEKITRLSNLHPIKGKEILSFTRPAHLVFKNDADEKQPSLYLNPPIAINFTTPDDYNYEGKDDGEKDTRWNLTVDSDGKVNCQYPVYQDDTLHLDIDIELRVPGSINGKSEKHYSINETVYTDIFNGEATHSEAFVDGEVFEINYEVQPADKDLTSGSCLCVGPATPTTEDPVYPVFLHKGEGYDYSSVITHDYDNSLVTNNPSDEIQKISAKERTSYNTYGIVGYRPYIEEDIPYLQTISSNLIADYLTAAEKGQVRVDDFESIPLKANSNVDTLSFVSEETVSAIDSLTSPIIYIKPAEEVDVIKRDLIIRLIDAKTEINKYTISNITLTNDTYYELPENVYKLLTDSEYEVEFRTAVTVNENIYLSAPIRSLNLPPKVIMNGDKEILTYDGKDYSADRKSWDAAIICPHILVTNDGKASSPTVYWKKVYLKFKEPTSPSYGFNLGLAVYDGEKEIALGENYDCVVAFDGEEKTKTIKLKYSYTKIGQEEPFRAGTKTFTINFEDVSLPTGTDLDFITITPKKTTEQQVNIATLVKSPSYLTQKLDGCDVTLTLNTSGPTLNPLEYTFEYEYKFDKITYDTIEKKTSTVSYTIGDLWNQFIKMVNAYADYHHKLQNDSFIGIKLINLRNLSHFVRNCKALAAYVNYFTQLTTIQDEVAYDANNPKISNFITLVSQFIEL